VKELTSEGVTSSHVYKFTSEEVKELTSEEVKK